MPAKIEPLNKGLWTAVDPTLMPEGSLRIAQNARYRPGDPALWHAEGRQVLASGGQGRGDPITQVVGLAWDPGTTVDGVASEPKQILYRAPQSAGIQTIPAKDVPTDPAMSASSSSQRAYALAEALGPDPLVAIQFQNDHYLLSGAKNSRITRSPQVFGRHGFPTNILPPTFANQTLVAGANLVFAKGWHYFWFTWLGEGGIESGAESDATIKLYVSSTLSRRIELLVDKSAFDAAVPDGATAIRIYKTIAKNADQGSVTSKFLDTGWPVGYRIAESTIAQVRLNTVISGGFAATNYQLLLVDSTALSQEDEDHLDTLPPYEFGSLVVSGEIANFSKAGTPPRSSTGDVFESSLVLNDLDDPRKIRYSWPERADWMPAPYYINFETDKTDEVVAIRALGTNLGVFLKTSAWRVRWLPTQADFDFSRGRVKEEVSGSQGTFGHYSVTKFDMPGQGPLLAYITRTGVYATDLFNNVKLTEHLDWKSMSADGLLLPQAQIFDDPDRERLVLILGPQLWLMHYDQAHMADGVMSVTGPLGRPGLVAGANLVSTENESRQLVTSDGIGDSLYYEGFGFSDLGLVQALQATTREIYPFGVGEEAETTDFLAHFKPGDGGGVVSLNVITKRQSGDLVKQVEDVPLGSRRLINVTGRALLESYEFNIKAESAGAAVAINYVGVESESLGEAQ